MNIKIARILFFNNRIIIKIVTGIKSSVHDMHKKAYKHAVLIYNIILKNSFGCCFFI